MSCEFQRYVPRKRVKFIAKNKFIFLCHTLREGGRERERERERERILGKSNLLDARTTKKIIVLKFVICYYC